MNKKLNIWLGFFLLAQAVLTTVNAEPAVEVLKQDFVFPNKIAGFPAKLSDIKGLEINYFTTNDGVKLAYWQAGKGKPVIFVPGWSANGADFIDVIYLLSSGYKVIVLDPRNQGLSEQVRQGQRISRYSMDLKQLTEHLAIKKRQGQRISRYSMDLKQLTEHLAIKKADFVGWSMGASVLWGYIDLFGTESINKLVWIDEPISIYTREDWSEQERRNAGGMTTSAERMIAAFSGAPTNNQVVDMKVMERFMAQDSLHFQNSQAFAKAVIKNNPEYMAQVLFDHITNDWRDVVQYKLDMPVAIFSGELSHNLPSQQWAQSVIPGAKLYVYTAAEQGDHFLAAKNPVKFVADLKAFLR